MLEAVVFDFDGLVMDSEWIIYEAAAAAFAQEGHSLSVSAWATIVGTNSNDDETWWPRLCAAAGVVGFERGVELQAVGREPCEHPRSHDDAETSPTYIWGATFV